MAEWKNPYNPFDSWKMMAHIPYWNRLLDGDVPPPRLVTIDPVNACNMRCPYCNASKVTGSGVKLANRLRGPMAKFLAAAVIAGGAVYWLHYHVLIMDTPFILIPEGFLGIAIYFGLLLVFREFTRDDYHFFMDLIHPGKMP